jgi:hypothetical protein
MIVSWKILKQFWRCGIFFILVYNLPSNYFLSLGPLDMYANSTNWSDPFYEQEGFDQNRTIDDNKIWSSVTTVIVRYVAEAKMMQTHIRLQNNEYSTDDMTLTLLIL